ncbi:MAG: DsrE family protein [Acidobacteriota bacterium]
MAKYLLIQSRDPFETNEVARDYEWAASLAGAGNGVTLFLVQNGVLPARKGARRNGLESLVARGVEVLTDEFSLRERGISKGALAEGVKVSTLDVVIDQLAEGRKAIWL